VTSLTPPRNFWSFVIENQLLLVAGTVMALLWANLGHDSYERFTHALHFPVNDIGMVFFFALAAKEIVEATLPGGALSSPREAGVPVLAAIGGMAGPAALYLIQVTIIGRSELVRGWAIPCATDIAFSYMAARLIFPKSHPAIPFLLLLAVADDALGLLLLAMFYPTGPISLTSFAAFLAAALGVALWLRSRRVRNFWAYTIGGGGLSWAAFYLGGVHPALALVPILPFMPHARRDLGLFVPEEHGLPDTMNRFEHWWTTPVQVILFFFGLTNAGVAFSTVGTGTWVVVSSLLVGKPVGIVLATYLAVTIGLRAPGGLGYRHTTVVGVVAGSGFTVSLFFSIAAFPAGQILHEVKMGALLSFVAAPLALVLALLTGVYRRQAGGRP
jgi:NhaA family Na+:H+ antiporter